MADGTVFIESALDMTGFNTGLGKLKSVAAKGFSVVSGAVATVTAGIEALGGAAIKVGSDFTAQMSTVEALSSASAQTVTMANGEIADGFEAISSKAKEIGATTSLSATESAQALEYMALAGWNAQEMYDGLAGVANLAAASGEDLANVSDILTDAITAFGDEASDATRYADVLAKTAASSNTDVGLLGYAFKYAAAMSGALGYELEDVSAALGLMANAGIKGSSAGTALNMILTRLSTNTNGARDKLEALGIEFYNSDGSARALRDVLMELCTATANYTDEQKTNLAHAIAGTSAQKGLLAIMNQGADVYDELADTLHNCTGAADEMAKTRLDNLAGDITLLKSAAESLGIAVYEGMESPLRDLAKNGIGYVNDLYDAFQTAGFDGLAQSVGSVFAQAVVYIAQQIPTAISMADGVIDAFCAGLLENKDAVLNAGLGVVSSVITAILSCVGSVGSTAVELAASLASGLAAGGSDIALSMSECVSGLLTSLANYMPTFVVAGVQFIQSVLGGIVETLPALIALGVETATDFLSGLTIAIPSILETGTKIIESLLNGITASLPNLLRQGSKIAVDFLAGLVRCLPDVTSAGVELLQTLAAGMETSAPSIVQAASECITGLVAAFVEFLPSLLDIGIQLVLSLINGIASSLPTLMGQAATIVATIAAKIGENIPALLAAGVQLVQAIATGIAENLPQLVSTGIELIGQLTQGIQSSLPNLIPLAMEALMDFSGTLRENVGNLVDAGLEMIQTLATALIDNIPVFVETIPTIVTNIAGIINDNAPKLLETGIELIGQLAMGLVQAIPTIISNIPQIIQAIASVLMAFNWVGLGSNIITFIKDGVTNLATSLPQALKNIGQTAKEWLHGIDWKTLGSNIITFIKDGIVSLLTAIPETLKSIGTTAVEWFKNIDWIDLGVDLVGGIISGISGALDGAVSAITDLGSSMLEGFKNFFGIHSPSTVMQDQGDYLVDGLINGITGLPDALMSTLSGAISSVMSWGSDLAKGGLDAAKNLLANVTAQLSQLPGKVNTQLTSVISKVSNWASAITSQAKTAAITMLNNVVLAISQLPGKFSSFLSSVIKNVTSWAASMTAKAKDAATTTLSNVVSSISQMPSKVASQLSGVIQNVNSWATTFASNAKTAAINALNNVVSQISQMPSKVMSQLSSVASNVSSWGSALTSKFRSIGSNVISGMINGIRSMVSSLYSSIKSALSGLVDKAKSALGIHSPSTVMRDEVGKWIPQGVAQGIKDNMSSVLKETANLTKGVATSLDKSTAMKAGENYAKSIADGIKRNKNYAKKSASEIGEAIVDAAEQKLSNYEIVHNVTLDYEVGFWKQILASCKKGTQAYYDAYKKYSDALTKYKEKSASAKEELVKLEESYAKNISSVETQLVKDMNELWDNYHSTVEKRSQDLYKDLGGPFEAFQSKTSNTTKTLVSNLQSQVTAMKNWQSDIESLEKRGVDTDLMAELRELGPESAADIELLTAMTDEELKQYVKLWKEKMALCTKQATAENQDLYKSTVSQVEQLKQDAKAQMDGYTKEFINSVKNLVTQTKNELGTLPAAFSDVGKQAMAGITAAIKKDSGSLNKEIQTLMANAVKAAKNALKIKSPSRVFRDEVGAMIPSGVAGGVKANTDVAVDAIGDLANEMASGMNVLNDIDGRQLELGVSIDWPDVSAMASQLMAGIQYELAGVSTKLVAKMIGGGSIEAALSNEMIDYDKLGSKVAKGISDAGIDVKLNNRPIGRILATT